MANSNKENWGKFVFLSKWRNASRASTLLVLTSLRIMSMDLCFELTIATSWTYAIPNKILIDSSFWLTGLASLLYLLFVNSSFNNFNSSSSFFSVAEIEFHHLQQPLCWLSLQWMAIGKRDGHLRNVCHEMRARNISWTDMQEERRDDQMNWNEASYNTSIFIQRLEHTS